MNISRYDENSFNQEVTGYFILREIHGRTDYRYNATAKDVRGKTV